MANSATPVARSSMVEHYPQVCSLLNLPKIPNIMRRLNELSFDQLAAGKDDRPFVMTADLRHYFHQFPVAPQIREYFAIACAGWNFQYKVLSMGWSYSPLASLNASHGGFFSTIP
jgi:hypothetical protein